MTQMTNNPAASTRRLLSEAELADELGLHPDTLAGWRREDVHPRPRHLQIGKAIRYRREDIDAFLAVCASTSEPDQPNPAVVTA